MKYFIFLALLTSACAPCEHYHSWINYCNDELTVSGTSVPPRIDGSIAISDVIAGQKYVELCIGEALDLYTITFHMQPGELVASQASDPLGQVIGFTRASDKDTNITISDDYHGDGGVIGIVAHELGHWYYFKSTGNSDHDHTHNEWFGRDGAKGHDFGGVGPEGTITDCAQYRAENQ